MGYPRYHKFPLSPSMNVMALRQAAVFRKAGSYVLSPASSEPALICLRSVARIAPSLMGTSYCLPVRLSVIVSVSAMLKSSVVSRQSSVVSRQSSVVSGVAFAGLGVLRYRLGRHAIATVDPPGEILKLAAFAAEGNPRCLGELAAAKNTDARRHGFTFY